MFTWPLASSRVHVSSGWRRDAGQIDDNLCSDLSRTIQRAHYKAEIHNRKAKLWGRRAYHRTVRISCIFFLLRILTKAGFTLKVWNAQSDFFSIYICSKMYEMQFPWGCSDNGCRKHRWITSECLFCFFLWLLLFFFFFSNLRDEADTPNATAYCMSLSHTCVTITDVNKRDVWGMTHSKHCKPIGLADWRISVRFKRHITSQSATCLTGSTSLNILWRFDFHLSVFINLDGRFYGNCSPWKVVSNVSIYVALICGTVVNWLVTMSV